MKKALNFIIKSRYVIIAFAFGLLIGLAIMVSTKPVQIAKLADGSESIAILKDDQSITADELYTVFKQKASIESVLELIDDKVLESDYPYEKYKTDSTERANELIDYYVTNGGATKEEVLAYFGYDTMDAFIEFLILDSRRYDYFHDLLTSKITEKDKKNFYKKNIFAPIGTQIISVSKNDSSSSDEKLIKEIQNKVNKGKSFDDIKSEYADNEDVKTADLGYITYDGGEDKTLVAAVRKLKNNSHSTKYITTDTYGYVIIFRTDEKEKPAYEDVEAVIVEDLFIQMGGDSDKELQKALINLRKEKGLKFTDTDYAKLYNDYVKANK